MGISNASNGLRSGVCTSSTRPTAPYEGQMIYETDTDRVLVWNGSAWYPNWNTAWGAVGFTSRTSSVTISSGTTVLSQSFTAVAGRLYKITHYEPVLYNTGTGYTIFYIREGATLLKESFMPNKTANEPSGWMEMHIGTFTAGTKTINITATSTNLSITNNSSLASSHLLIEDIGPA